MKGGNRKLDLVVVAAFLTLAASPVLAASELMTSRCNEIAADDGGGGKGGDRTPPPDRDRGRGGN